MLPCTATEKPPPLGPTDGESTLAEGDVYLVRVAVASWGWGLRLGVGLGAIRLEPRYNRRRRAPLEVERARVHLRQVGCRHREGAVRAWRADGGRHALVLPARLRET